MRIDTQAPGRDLDAMVATALGWREVGHFSWGEWGGINPLDGLPWEIPPYTTEPDDLAPLGEMLAFLSNCNLTISKSTVNAYWSVTPTTSSGAGREWFHAPTLKHAIALLVLEIANGF